MLYVIQYPPFALIEMLIFMRRFLVLSNVHGLFMTSKHEELKVEAIEGRKNKNDVEFC